MVLSSRIFFSVQTDFSLYFRLRSSRVTLHTSCVCAVVICPALISFTWSLLPCPSMCGSNTHIKCVFPVRLVPVFALYPLCFNLNVLVLFRFWIFAFWISLSFVGLLLVLPLGGFKFEIMFWFNESWNLTCCACCAWVWTLFSNVSGPACDTLTYFQQSRRWKK